MIYICSMHQILTDHENSVVHGSGNKFTTSITNMSTLGYIIVRYHKY